MPNRFASKFANFGDSLKGAVGDAIDKIDDAIDKIDDKIDMPIIIDFVGIKRAGDECYEMARETSGLCKTTIDKANEMVAFGQELQTTLDDVCKSKYKSRGASGAHNSKGIIDASKFKIIQELVEGEKMQSATLLAKELSALSLECVDKSKAMMLSMEKGIDALPDIVEPFVEQGLKASAARNKGHRKGDPELPDIEASVQDLKSLVSGVETVGLFTVVERGSAAFEGLRTNGELSKNMFLSIQEFAESIESVSGSVRGLKRESMTAKSYLKLMGPMKTVAKDAWRCLRLSGLMKDFAEQVGRLIHWIIALFQTASAKLGAIWGALANAKDAMAGCLVYVTESIRLCDDSKTKSLLLRDTSRNIHHHLSNILKFRKTGAAKAVDSLRELADGDEILLCIDLGTNIDDMFTDCVEQVVATIDQINGAIVKMPDVLTRDVPELACATNCVEYDDEIKQCVRGTTNPPGIRATASSLNVDDDVRQLKSIQSSIEEASPLTVIHRSADGFASVGSTIETCGNMISTSRGFAKTCQTSIESFTNAEWDLESARGHILELVAVRDAGVQMKEFVHGVLELVRANLALMKAVRSKSKGVAGGAESTNIGSLVGSLATEVDIDDLQAIGQGIQKLGSLFK